MVDFGFLFDRIAVTEDGQQGLKWLPFDYGSARRATMGCCFGVDLRSCHQLLRVGRRRGDQGLVSAATRGWCGNDRRGV